MAVDTKTERLSLLGYGWPPSRALPEPDGALDVGDRLHLMRLFASAAAAAPPSVMQPIRLDGTVSYPLETDTDSYPLEDATAGWPTHTDLITLPEDF